MDEDIKTVLDLQPKWKLWLEKDGVYVFGPGAFSLLSAIQQTGSLTAGARATGMSYRYAWGVIKKIEKKLGVKIIETFRGGSVGGGGAIVTEAGVYLMNLFSRINREFKRAAGD